MEYLEETPEFWFTERASADEVVDATIVVPVYNAEETLARALRSVLHQSMRTLEVIVVDDASTDGSWSLIRRRIVEFHSWMAPIIVHNFPDQGSHFLSDAFVVVQESL